MCTPGQRRVAHINVGRTVASLDDPRLAGFVSSQLAAINALADRAPASCGDANGERRRDVRARLRRSARDRDMSVWELLDALHDYVCWSAHIAVLRDRKRRFENWSAPYYALW